jgi:hypothetical protein
VRVCESDNEGGPGCCVFNHPRQRAIGDTLTLVMYIYRDVAAEAGVLIENKVRE